jgi:hypothetical protein
MRVCRLTCKMSYNRQGRGVTNVTLSFAFAFGVVQKNYMFYSYRNIPGIIPRYDVLC